MASKWAHLTKETDADGNRKFPEPPVKPEFEAVVDKTKFANFEEYVQHLRTRYAETPFEDLDAMLAALEEEEAAIDAQLTDVHAQQEAINRVVINRLTDLALQSIKLARGGSLGLGALPQFKISDPAAFRRWVEETQPEILTVYAQTRDGIAKAKLEAGEPLPPGIELTNVRTTVTRRKK